jgi:23S rRNA (cytidine1920-2'-O)/16S rRNA (cytidine1409-2'-O)-methyltransferase
VIFKKKRIKYVSRSALKLEFAIKKWPYLISNQICIDIGSSTGGFGEVLLKKCARKVYCVDLNYGQFSWNLRENKEIKNIERMNVMKIDSIVLKKRGKIISVDLSFISLLRVLPKIMSLMDYESSAYLLIKPQFEVLKKNNRRGIVYEKKIRKDSLQMILMCAGMLNLETKGVIKSNVVGVNGNMEYLAFFIKKNLLFPLEDCVFF